MASSRLDPSDLTFQRAIVEIRYPKAHRYWDVSGKLIETIETRIPGTTCEELQEGFRFSGGVGASIAFGLFYWNKVVVQQGQSHSASKFGATAQEFWDLVRHGLGVQDPTRVGHRIWYLLPASSPMAASEWLRKQQMWTLPRGLENDWGTPSGDGIVLRTELPDRRLRLEVTAGELKEGDGASRSGVISDLDVVASDPKGSSTSINDFVRKNYRFADEHMKSLFVKQE